MDCWGPDQTGPHSKFQATQSYIMRPCLKFFFIWTHPSNKNFIFIICLPYKNLTNVDIGEPFWDKVLFNSGWPQTSWERPLLLILCLRSLVLCPETVKIFFLSCFGLFTKLSVNSKDPESVWGKILIVKLFSYFHDFFFLKIKTLQKGMSLYNCS